MKFKALVAGVLGSFAISTAAFAADVIIIPPPAPPPPVAAPLGYNWGGLYAGASIFTAIGGGGVGGGIAFGGQVGFNIDRGSGLVFGAEGYFLTGGGTAFGAKAKVGFALGDSRRTLLYGSAGALFVGGTIITFGGGASFAFGERLSAFVEVDAITAGGAVACCLLRAGVNFAFGN